MEGGASVGSLFMVVNGATTSALAPQARDQSATRDVTAVIYQTGDPLDCFIAKANAMASWSDNAGHPFRPAGLDKNGGKIQRDYTTGKLLPYPCKDGVSPEFCTKFQNETNNFIVGANDILQSLKSKVDNCEK
jgi:hypothetical protein